MCVRIESNTDARAQVDVCALLHTTVIPATDSDYGHMRHADTPDL